MRLASTFTMRIVALLLLTLTCIGSATAADTKSSEKRGSMVLSEGRRYMVAFPQVWASPSEKPMAQPMMLLISSRTKTKVRVMTPATINEAPRMDKEFTVEANKVLKVPISVAYMNTQSETKTGFGIVVDAKTPISVSTFQQWNGNGEMARHLPVEGWGKNYYTMNFYQDRYGTPSEGYNYRPSQILVIADKDNTVLTYTPTFGTEGGMETSPVKKGASQTITLEKGECFLIKAKIDEMKNKEWESDLSGTMIKASKPVGVVSGHTKVGILRYPDILVGLGGSSPAHFVRNNVHDAMLPIEMAGTKFVTVPCRYTSTRITGKASAEFGVEDDRGDVIRVIALEDGTTVKTMRQDGSSFKNEWVLRKGETRIMPSLEVPTYWESDKPILMGQYGKSYAKDRGVAVRGSSKGEESALGHPSVESGMPMLQYIPSTDRFVEYGVFSAPEGMDNFLNIVFKADEITKIKFDNKALNSAFGGAMRYLKGTPYACLAVPVGPGDHVIESVDPKVRWSAWTYGSLDGLTQGRAYGTPISIDMTIPCDDSVMVKEEIVCGDIDAEGKIMPENISCGSIFAVYPEQLANYTLEVDPEFNTGDKTAKFKLKVDDKTKDAMAVIRVVTRSGKFVEKTYTYTADKISWSPARINFGTIAFNTPESATLTIKNESADRPVNVKKVTVRAYNTIFVCTPNGGFTLGPSESKDIKVTATIQSAPEVVDTVLVELDCYTVKAAELRVRGEQPQIYVSDINWGQIPASSPGVERKVTIQNGSRVDLLLSGYQESLLDGSGRFFNARTLDGKPLASAFPMAIPGNGKYEFYVTYSPKGEANVPHSVSVPFFSNATEVDSIAILEGSGVKAELLVNKEEWNERVIDNVQKGLNIAEYRKTITFFNFGNQPSTFSAPSIRGKDKDAFRIVDNGTAGSFPIQLVGGGADQSRTVTVAFIPSELPNRGAERKDYEAEIVFPTDSKDQPEVSATLAGLAWQPHVKGEDLEFPGTMNLGEAAQTLTIPISNSSKDDFSNPTTGNVSGTNDVVITNIRITDPNTRFELLNAPTPQNPWRIKPGETPMQLQVRFDPQFSGPFTSPYVIETNVGTNGQAPYEPTYTLKARVQGGDFTVTGDAGDQYVFNEKILKVKVTHSELVSRRFTYADFAEGPDASSFIVLPHKSTGANYLDIGPGETGEIEVRFVPSFVTLMENGQANIESAKAKTQGLLRRNEVHTATLKITEELTGKDKVAQLSGNGKYLETTNFVGDAYSAAPGGNVDVAVELSGAPQAVDASNMTELRVRLNYDPRIVKPRSDVKDIILAGTQMEGWTVLKSSVTGKPGDALNQIELDLVDQRATKKALSSNSKLPMFKVKFDVFFNQSLQGTFSTPVAVYSYWVDLDASNNREDYVLFVDKPGKITVTLPCANIRRLATFSTTKYGVKPVRPNPVVNTGVISFGVGIAAPTRIEMFNAMGEKVMTLVDQKLEVGEYDLTLDASTIPAGTYYYHVVSGPFTSEPQTLTIVK